MEVENLVGNIITLLPNIAVAIWMLHQQGRTIDSLLDNQTKLIDRLLNFVDTEKQRAELVIAQQKPATQSRRATVPNGNLTAN